MELDKCIEGINFQAMALQKLKFKNWNIIQANGSCFIETIIEPQETVNYLYDDSINFVCERKQFELKRVAQGIPWAISQSRFHNLFTKLRNEFPDTVVNSYSKIKDPGSARRILKGKKNARGQLYTNKKLKRMPISDLKACAQRHTIVELTTYLTARIAVDSKSKTIYVQDERLTIPSFIYIAADYYLENLL